MILSKLSLRNCGPFEDANFTFSPEFNPLFGENETGKSTTSQSIPDLLFGKIEKSLYDLVHSTDQLEIEAEIHVNDTPHLFVQKNSTFSQKSITRGDEKQFNSRKSFNAHFIPAGIDKEFYESAFRLNADELKKSRKLFAEDTGKINAVLFNVMGNETFSALPDALKSEADALYSPSGNARKKAINKLRIEIDELKEEIHAHSLSAEQYTGESKKISTLKKKEDVKKEEIRSLENKKDETFAKLQLNADNYFNYIRLQDEIKRTVYSLSFTEQEVEQITEYLNKLKIRKVSISDLKDRISDAQEILDDIHVDAAILEKEKEIKDLNERRGLYISNLDSVSGLKQGIKEAEDKIGEKVALLNLLPREGQIDKVKLEKIANSSDIQLELYRLLKEVDEELHYNIPSTVNEEKGKKLVNSANTLKDTLSTLKKNISSVNIKIDNKQTEIDAIVIEVDANKLIEARSERDSEWQVLVSNIANIQHVDHEYVKAFEASENALDSNIDSMLQDAEQVGKRSALQEELNKLKADLQKESDEYHALKETFPAIKEEWELYCKEELHTLDLSSTQFEEWNNTRKEALTLIAQKEKDIETLAVLTKKINTFEEDAESLNEIFSESGDITTLVETLIERLNSAIKSNHSFQMNTSNMNSDKEILAKKEVAQNKQIEQLESFYPVELKGRSFEAIEAQLEQIKNQIKTKQTHTHLKDELIKVFGEDIESAFSGFETKEDIEEGFADIKDKIKEENINLGGVSDELKELESDVEDAMSQDESILEKHQELESKKLKMKELIDRYLQVKISSRVIQRLNNLLGTQAAKDLIVRAGEYFELITGGNYTHLSVDENNFYARRKKGTSDIDNGVISTTNIDEEYITVYDTQMSEGTKDQLFLSLRLAFISMFNETSDKKLPFIADDILVNFDDQRIENALKLLKKFSKTTQVFFFTHSSRVIEIWNKVKV